MIPNFELCNFFSLNEGLSCPHLETQLIFFRDALIAIRLDAIFNVVSITRLVLRMNFVILQNRFDFTYTVLQM